MTRIVRRDGKISRKNDSFKLWSSINVCSRRLCYTLSKNWAASLEQFYSEDFYTIDKRNMDDNTNFRIVLFCITIISRLVSKAVSPFSTNQSQPQNKLTIAPSCTPVFCSSFMYLLWILIGLFDNTRALWFPVKLSLWFYPRTEHLSPSIIEKLNYCLTKQKINFSNELKNDYVSLRTIFRCI